MIDGCKIVTVCNRIPQEPYYCLHEWAKSLRGVQPLVLGTQVGEYGGLGSKPRLLYKAIKEGLVDTKYIIFCDCWDLVFAVPPSYLFSTFISMGVPFVISAEKNCFPDTYKQQYDLLDSGGSKYKYLNSGMIVAETEAMLAVLESMDAQNIPNDYFDAERNCMVHPNDQQYYQLEFLKQPVKMVLDYDQLLCGTLHDVALDELEFITNDGVRIKETGVYPCSFHMNGGAKTSGVREPLLKHLNLL